MPIQSSLNPLKRSVSHSPEPPLLNEDSTPAATNKKQKSKSRAIKNNIRAAKHQAVQKGIEIGLTHGEAALKEAQALAQHSAEMVHLLEQDLVARTVGWNLNEGRKDPKTWRTIPSAVQVTHSEAAMARLDEAISKTNVNSVSEEQLEHHGLIKHRVKSGHNIYYQEMQTEDGTIICEPVLMVRFVPQKDMTPEEIEESQACVEYFDGVLATGSKCLSNGAHKDAKVGKELQGGMHTEGWCKGYSEYDLSSYAPQGGMRGWSEQKKLGSKIKEILNKGWRALWNHGFISQAEKSNIDGLPCFSQTSSLQEGIDEDDIMGCNVTVTASRPPKGKEDQRYKIPFANKWHRDRDAIGYFAWGRWISTKNGKLRQPGVESHIKGGNFFFCGYGILIDFSECDGVVDVAWRGSLDPHQTTSGQIPLDEERYGSSVQVNRRLADAIGKSRPGDLKVRDDDEWIRERGWTSDFETLISRNLSQQQTVEELYNEQSAARDAEGDSEA